MARILCVAPPFVAHVIPLDCVAAELEKRGHSVAWVVHPGLRSRLRPGATVYEAQTLDRETLDSMASESLQPWVAGFRYFFEDIAVPLGRLMLPVVLDAIDQFQPDLIIGDQQALAAPLAARLRGLPWVTSSPSGQLLSRDLDSYPQLAAWVRGLFDDLQREVGLDPVAELDVSPYLVLVYSGQIMASGPLPPHFRLVGPPIDTRQDDTPFDWHLLTDQRKVYVSLGTTGVVKGSRFMQVLQEALGDEDVQVIVSMSGVSLEGLPPNFIVRSWMPQVDVLRRVDAVVCHSGSTTNEALVLGLPCVLLPIAFDQSGYAERIVANGAGVRLRFRRLTAPELRAGVRAVLDEPSYRQAARRIQESLLAGGGARGAADAVEQLIEKHD